ncbi:hypothetical protein GCM10027589_16470 [Actinocorallia lasiicapitis]
MTLTHASRRAAAGIALFCAAIAGTVLVAPPSAHADGYYCGQRVLGAIEGRYLAMGGPSGALGCPRTGELTNPDGYGRRTQFQNGTIYWSPNTGAWPVWGRIGDVWCSLGCERGPIGYPTSYEYRAPYGGEIWQNFRCGQLHYIPSLDSVGRTPNTCV